MGGAVESAMKPSLNRGTNDSCRRICRSYYFLGNVDCPWSARGGRVLHPARAMAAARTTTPGATVGHANGHGRRATPRRV
jgi:hypothetical protein